ncbi:hypothetical protein ACJX0J_012948, partial [Zea mays]
MASPPPFDLCGDLDDDDIDKPVTAVPKDRRLPAAAPTPNGLNDHLLRFTRSLQRPTQNHNPSPNLPPPPPPGTKPSAAARSRTQHLTPLPCAITVDDDLDDHSPNDVDAH